MSDPAAGDGDGPTVRALPDADACAAAAAALVAEVIAAAGGRARIALSGGGTPVAAYRRLGPLVPDWSAVDVFLADERCVPFDDPDSNARLVVEALEPAARELRVHRLVEQGTPVDRAGAYAHDLGEDPLDLVLLGLGEDGHTASLFPGHGALEAEGRTVAVLDSPKPPPERVTLTLPTLAAARRLVLLVTGAGKAAALARSLGEPGPHAPATLLPRERLTVIADEAALADARAAGLVSS
ncbi:6-phosphogluconolactonase [Patulibacter defluvii]|uniref:6-phosphogluconolactonase n=1 Tax=Patulibacter defluvii TaxID=3095358 RepID=UPI002A760C41|nr:6-phosphogluconolactonase [Patulibacter sp. DM4]